MKRSHKVVGSNPVQLVLRRKGRDILTAQRELRLSEHTGKRTTVVDMKVNMRPANLHSVLS